MTLQITNSCPGMLESANVTGHNIDFVMKFGNDSYQSS